jgi:hypothetical protein
MKVLRLLVLLAVTSMFIFIGCDSTDPDDGSNQTDVENTLKALDLQMAGMGDIGSFSLLQALESMPEGLMDVPTVLPKLVKTVTPRNLSKNSVNGRIFETLADTTIQSILEMLDSLYGTHTYINFEWVSDDTPSDEIIIIYPFLDVETNESHTAKIRMHSITVSQTVIGGSLEIYVDNIRQLWVTLELTGSDLVSEYAIPSSVDISGGILADNGITLEFSLEVNNSGVSVSLGAAGFPPLILAMEIDNLFEAMNSDTEPMPTSISLSYSEVELVMNEFENITVGSDIGDVYYAGNKVGDLIVEETGLYIVFNNGNKRNIEDLMPHSMELMADVQLP